MSYISYILSLKHNIHTMTEKNIFYLKCFLIINIPNKNVNTHRRWHAK